MEQDVPFGKTFFLQCQRRHPELLKIPTYLVQILQNASERPECPNLLHPLPNLHAHSLRMFMTS